MRNLVALVLGGGRGTRLYPLTKYRSKPAVPLAAKYRLIDIPLSNCLNSDINRIYVLTQFLSVSLHRHIRHAYQFDPYHGGFVEILAAQQTMDGGTDWYQGTADAVRKQMRYLQQPDVEYVLILSGDQLYRMDYRAMLEAHQRAKADVTIAAIPVSRDQAGALGVMRCDEAGRVVGFLEKPKTDREIDLVRTDPAWIDARGVPSRGRECLASMGIYIFNKATLIDVLEKTGYQDFGKEVFPASIRTRRVQMHLFDDYWEDIGTIRAFFEANLSLAGTGAPFPLASAEAPVYTRTRFLPPTRIDGASIRESLIADGCQIGRGSIIENSVIGVRCRIGERVVIRHAILMGTDAYESAAMRVEAGKRGAPPMGIGDGTVIEHAIVDKNCRIGRDVRLVNEDGIEDSDDADDCVVRDGIPVVVKEASIRTGWRLAGRHATATA
ncbi:MAG: glucose-1-phosphate adenylyltransferase [Planctomycetes bacterium]|nr:glucose-1-phosphate adenylyltransferase [Planctomycetota bacterium]